MAQLLLAADGRIVDIRADAGTWTASEVGPGRPCVLLRVDGLTPGTAAERYLRDGARIDRDGLPAAARSALVATGACDLSPGDVIGAEP